MGVYGQLSTLAALMWADVLYCTALLLYVVMWRRNGPAMVRRPHKRGNSLTFVQGTKAVREAILTVLKWGPALKCIPH